MITVGIDLAAQPKGTVSCRIEWSGRDVIVHPPKGRLDDAALISACEGADKVGVDVPFGWPEEFAAAIAAHRRGEHIGNGSIRRQRYRATDLYVQSQTKEWPLSVSTDRIGVTALRAARVLNPSDRAGRGTVVEVYPAAALKRWGFNPKGYKKKKGAAVRANLLAKFCDGIGAWCAIPGEVRKAFIESDDALDAFVSALVARASALGLCDGVKDEERAKVEGWIALPAADGLKRMIDPEVKP